MRRSLSPLVLLALLALAGCEPATGPTPDGVEIRVHNNSDHDFESVILDGVAYGNLPSARSSTYRPQPGAYGHGTVEVTLRGKKAWSSPIDHVGATPLPTGSYTLMVSVAEVDGKLLLHQHLVRGGRLPTGRQLPGRDRVRSVHEHVGDVSAARGHGGGYGVSWRWVTTTYVNPTVSLVPGSRVVYLPDAVVGSQGVRRMLGEVAPEGALRWSRPVWENGERLVHALAPSSDGGYLLAGEAMVADTLPDGRPGARTEAWLVKTDPLGGTHWSRRFGGGGQRYRTARALHPLDDGGYVMAGQSGNGAWLARGDAAGNERWRSEIPSPGAAETVYPAPGGGFLLAGDRFGTLSEEPRGWVARTDPSGRELWSARLGGSVLAVLPTAEGGALAAGEGSPPRTGGQIVRVSGAGKVEEVRSYPGAVTTLHDAAPLPDGGYVLAGVNGSGLALVRLDAEHATLWTRSHPVSSGAGQTRSAFVFPDAEGFVLIGASDDRIWMTRTDAAGTRTWSRVVVQP